MTRATITAYLWLVFVVLAYVCAGTVDFQTVAGR